MSVGRDLEPRAERTETSMGSLTPIDVLYLRLAYPPQDFDKLTMKSPEQFPGFMRTFDQWVQAARVSLLLNIPAQSTEEQPGARNTLGDLTLEELVSLKLAYSPQDFDKIVTKSPEQLASHMIGFNKWLQTRGAEQGSNASGFVKLLDTGAARLKALGFFAVELSAGNLEQTMRQVMVQSEGVMREKGITAEINELPIQIKNAIGEVSATVTASKRLIGPFDSPSYRIRAQFGLANIVDQAQKPTGRLKSTHLEVDPEEIWGYKPRTDFAKRVEGEKANDSFRGVLDKEMQRRGAVIDGLALAFTPSNTLKIAAIGGKN